MQPRIGIPLSLDALERGTPGRRDERLERSYVEAVAEAGGLSFGLPLQASPAQLVHDIDGLLLPGGGDFAPTEWEATTRGAPYPREAFQLAAPELIEFQSALLAEALRAQKPVLGICFGMQLMALGSGGTLHYHLPSDLPQAQTHQLRDPDAQHRIRIEAHSLLARSLGHTETTVNSRHHQAVASVGANWKISARSHDAVIEAIESDVGEFCLGVQWHPENMNDLHRRALFRSFLQAAARTRP